MRGLAALNTPRLSKLITPAAPSLLEREEAPTRTDRMDNVVKERPSTEARLEAELSALESAMPSLQSHADNVFALASAWAERHDAIVSATPAKMLGKVEARLRQIGIRRGLMHGPRTTAQFPALPPQSVRDASQEKNIEEVQTSQ